MVVCTGLSVIVGYIGIKFMVRRGGRDRDMEKDGCKRVG